MIPAGEETGNGVAFREKLRKSFILEKEFRYDCLKYQNREFLWKLSAFAFCDNYSCQYAGKFVENHNKGLAIP